VVDELMPSKSARPEAANARAPSDRPPRRALAWLAAAGLALGVVATSAVAPPGTPADGTIAGGVFVGDVDVSGLTEAEARERLERFSEELERQTVLLSLGSRETVASVGQLGLRLDVDATLASALGAAREGGLRGLTRAFLRSRTVLPVSLTADEAAFREVLPSVAEVLVDDPPFDGAIEIVGGSPEAKLPRAGRRIDGDALLGALRRHVEEASSSPVVVPVDDVVPQIAAEDVAARVRDADLLLRGPITLAYAPPEALVEQLRKENDDAERRHREEADRAKWRIPKKKSRMKRKGKRLVEEVSKKKPDTLPLPEPVEVTFTKEDLLLAFRARRVDEPTPHFVVELDEAEVKRKLAPVVSKLYNAARDARFEIDEQSRVTIQPSRPGTRVDGSRLVEALVAAASTPERRGELPVDDDAEPAFTTKAAEQLAIKELVSEYTTHFTCCQPRVKNIHRICDMLNGTIVKTGDTLSVNSAVGPRSAARGFLVAPSIGDGEMTETPGGGVSQFATTLYNALFDGGYVIRERKAHSFYFSRYPMGIEATLSYPSPDLVFMNDTKAALLLRCDYGETFVRVRLFGDGMGRKVDRSVSKPFEYTDPKVEYLANPTREPDDSKVKDHGSHGFSVITKRVITEADGTSRTERRTVKYTGKPRLIETHPCNIPKGEKGHTGERCPKVEEDEEPNATEG
jgi:vancomycin resistance protein YoaR